MNTFMIYAGNFVGMCKFYFLNMAKFCEYEYGRILWVWKNFVYTEKFYGYEALAMEVLMLDHGKFLL